MADASFAPDDPLEDARRLIADGRPEEAAGLLGRLIGEGRGGTLARLALTRALIAAGRTSEALAAARETAMLQPSLAEAALALGEALLRAEQLPAAIAESQRALRLDPASAEARFLLGCAWLAAGEAEKALDALTELPAATPGLKEKRAEAEAIKARPRSDAGYVRHLFDQFSADYDARMLSQLHYRAPLLLKELAGLVMPGETGLDILDLGCGTGLSGAAFKDRAARLDGIDLSPLMIEKARDRGIYEGLCVGDIEGDLGSGCYDLVLAADTLVYLGDLDPVTASAARALRPGGFFLFTVEAGPGDGFELGPKRRWRHSELYLRALAAKHGFAVAGLMTCTPRREAGQPVDGFAAALHKDHEP